MPSFLTGPTISTDIVGSIRFRDAGRPDLVCERQILAELEDGKVHVRGVGVVVNMLVDRPGGHPPLAAHFLDGSLEYVDLRSIYKFWQALIFRMTDLKVDYFR